jgi:hypothetical protein
MPEVKLNKLSEHFFDFLKNYGIDFQWIDLVETERISGKKVLVPREFLEKRGHDIEIEFMEKLNILGRYKDPSKRKSFLTDILNISFRNLIDLIPKEVLELFVKLQTV